MKRIVIPEYGQIVRWSHKNLPPGDTERIAYLEEPVYRRLEKCEHQLTRDGQPVFMFYKDYIQAQQWVGIVQIPGLQVEILPKVDTKSSETSAAETDQWCETRRNLLYMLAVSGDVPLRTRDMARLATRRAPLNETLSALFANTLMGELLRGCERNYVTYEENLRCFKGRLLVGHNRGMCPHKGVVNALLNGKTPTIQVLTVDVVIASLLQLQGINHVETFREKKMTSRLLPTPTVADTFTGNLQSSQQKDTSCHSVNLSQALTHPFYSQEDSPASLSHAPGSAEARDSL